MNEQPLVSVAIPVYNGEKWLASALDSVLEQTYGNIEIILSDNASTDSSEQICKKYAEKNPNVFYYRNDKNIGVSENFNAAFLKARGKYVKWSSVSDYIKPDMIEKCVEVLEKNNDCVLCNSKTKLFNPEKNYEEEYEHEMRLVQDSAYERFMDFFKKIKLNNAMNGVIRSDALRKTGLYKRYMSADVNMIAELTMYGKFEELPEYLFYRRIDPETATILKPVDEIWKYYDPYDEIPMRFQNWKMSFALLGPAIVAPISIKDKFLIVTGILKRAFWSRHDLWDDLAKEIRKLFVRSSN